MPLFEFTTRFVRSPDEAESLVQAWKRLAETALEPNSFYEPWALLPAWRNLTGDQQPELLVVEAPKRVHPAGPKVLCGLFPILPRRRFYGLPVRCWELWRHVHCFLTTPLVRRDCAREVVDCFFHAAATDKQGAAVVHAEMLPAEGPLHKVIVEANLAVGRSTFLRELSTRALFRASADAETFLKAGLSRNKRLGIQRTERRLAESGTLETRWFTAGDDLDFPVAAPHWVQNGPEVSISFSITFQTKDSADRKSLHRLDKQLRRWGLKPSNVGKSAWRDRCKLGLVNGIRAAKAAVGLKDKK